MKLKKMSVMDIFGGKGKIPVLDEKTYQRLNKEFGNARKEAMDNYWFPITFGADGFVLEDRTAHDVISFPEGGKVNSALEAIDFMEAYLKQREKELSGALETELSKPSRATFETQLRGVRIGALACDVVRNVEQERLYHLDEDTVDRLNDAFSEAREKLLADGEATVTFDLDRVEVSIPTPSGTDYNMMAKFPQDVKNADSALRFLGNKIEHLTSKATQIPNQTDRDAILTGLQTCADYTDAVLRQETDGICIEQQANDQYKQRRKVYDEVLPLLKNAFEKVGLEADAECTLDTLGVLFNVPRTEYDGVLNIPLPVHADTKEKLLRAIEKDAILQASDFDAKEAIGAHLSHCKDAFALVREVEAYKDNLHQASVVCAAVCAEELDGAKGAVSQYAKKNMDKEIEKQKTVLRETAKKLGKLGIKPREMANDIKKAVEKEQPQVAR